MLQNTKTAILRLVWLFFKTKIMKKHSIDIYTLLFIAVLFMITRLLAGCSASRDVQKEKIDVKTDQTTDQHRETTLNSVTRTDEVIVANTEVTEKVDTLISVPDPRTGLFINVPVRFDKVTKKTEFGTKKTEKLVLWLFLNVPYFYKIYRKLRYEFFRI